MTAPLWQYFTLMTFIALSFIVNMIGIAALAVADRSKLPKNYEELKISSLMFSILVSIFGGYLSYSLYIWCPGLLGTGILILHWTGMISGFIKRIHAAGKVINYDKGMGEIVFAILYGIFLLGLMIAYGVKCL